MSMITELIRDLRAQEDICKLSGAFGYGKMLADAADTIEELSAKLHTANMERSSQYYNGGWIPVEKRLPEERKVVIVTLGNLDVDFCCYRPDINKFGWYSTRKGWQDNNDVIAWRPLPEPYSPNEKEVEDGEI